eukprot:m.174940 g.174940  ORF g.174940 m.174940 type:complete len:54 (+) comp16760_c0_seq9:2003-2164(+)
MRCHNGFVTAKRSCCCHIENADINFLIQSCQLSTLQYTPGINNAGTCILYFRQ